MIDYTLNVPSLLSLAVLVFSSIYALGQWVGKVNTSQDDGASKGEIAKLRNHTDHDVNVLRNKVIDNSRRILEVERTMVRDRELSQLINRIEAMERNFNARLEDR